MLESEFYIRKLIPRLYYEDNSELDIFVFDIKNNFKVNAEYEEIEAIALIFSPALLKKLNWKPFSIEDCEEEEVIIPWRVQYLSPNLSAVIFGL